LDKAWEAGPYFRRIKKNGSDNEWHSIDATIIRAHRHAAGAIGGQEHEALGKSRGGFGTKIHAKVDALGYPLEFILTGGQESEINQAEALVQGGECSALLADKGYDSDAFRIYLKEKNIIPVIPGRSNRKEEILYDRDLYKERNVVERFFSRIKEFRRIATRYDKRATMFMGALILASIIIWLKIL
jgi:transposase